MEKKNRDYPKIIITLITLGVMLGAFNHCVIEAPKKATRSTATSTSTSTPTNPSPVLPTPVVVTPTPGVPTPGTPTAGQAFFDSTVEPAFQAQCMVCHAPPINNPPLPGPLTIYNYDQMRVKLLNGTNATDNELIRKVQNQIGHAGGNQCGSNSAICQNLQDWYAQEMGIVNPVPPVNGMSGAVSVISPLGKVTGYAGNSADPTETIYVNFYLDGPSGAGVLINQAPIAANQAGFNGGIAGNHAYTYFLPIIYRDGNPYTLYAYAVNTDNGMETQLQGSPYAFTAYVSNINGFNYYTNTLKPILDQRCAVCHAFSYDQNFSSLLSPSPSNGGTATNNEMINMPAGGNMGLAHPGGNICGNRDGSPCAEIQTWWNNEFN